MLAIKSVLIPFNIKLGTKKPQELKLILENKDEEKKLLTLAFMVAKDLAVESTGMNNKLERTIGEMAPGESKTFYFQIFTKPTTTARDYPARLIIYEHYGDYKFVQKEYKKDMVIRVVR
ncbi:MAG: hypothetical protein PHH82_04205 [Candidatus ainarchaeum sp.]|nr:hypothetical protein [Candidatus ainarchaeum sp.]